MERELEETLRLAEARQLTLNKLSRWRHEKVYSFRLEIVLFLGPSARFEHLCYYPQLSAQEVPCSASHSPGNHRFPGNRLA
jgi:hypothetical protein